MSDRSSLPGIAARAGLAAVSVALLAVPLSRAATATLWADLVDPSGLGGETLALTLAGDRLYAVGEIDTGRGTRGGWVVRAYDADSGVLAWRDRTTALRASRVVVAGDRVVVAGFARRPRGADALVQVHDADSGRILWTDRHFLGFLLTQELEPWMVHVAVDRGRLFVATQPEIISPNIGAFLDEIEIRAYDLDSGRLLWERLIPSADPDFFPTERNLFGGLVAHRGVVVVVGQTATAAEPQDLLARAYDGATGALRWRAPIDDDVLERGEGVLASRGLVYIVNVRHPAPVLTRDPVIEITARRIADGDLRWRRRLRAEGGCEGFCVDAVALAGPRLLLARDTDRGEDVLVHAFRRSSGEDSWTYRLDTFGFIGSGGVPLALDGSAGRARLLVGVREGDSARSPRVLQLLTLGSVRGRLRETLELGLDDLASSDRVGPVLSAGRRTYVGGRLDGALFVGAFEDR